MEQLLFFAVRYNIRLCYSILHANSTAINHEQNLLQLLKIQKFQDTHTPYTRKDRKSVFLLTINTMCSLAKSIT